jgi:hypothetical protein
VPLRSGDIVTVKARHDGRVIPLRARVTQVRRDDFNVAETAGQVWGSYPALLACADEGTEWACGWETPEALEFKARLALLA